MITQTLRRLLALSSLLSATAAFAAPLSFDFKDPKGVNNVHFVLDAPLESISGTATGINGTVLFDPANPAATTGKIVLATESLTLGNSTMKDHMHGKQWLDVATFPEITFEAIALTDVKTTGNKTTATVSGKLTIKGITRAITAPVSFTYLPDMLGARLGKKEIQGDLLVLRSTFTIERSDYDIMAGKYADKVSNTIELSLSLAGATLKP